MPLLMNHNNVWLDCVLLSVNELENTVNVCVLHNNNNNVLQTLNNIPTSNILIKQHVEIKE